MGKGCRQSQYLSDRRSFDSASVARSRSRCPRLVEPVSGCTRAGPSERVGAVRTACHTGSSVGGVAAVPLDATLAASSAMLLRSLRSSQPLPLPFCCGSPSLTSSLTRRKTQSQPPSRPLSGFRLCGPLAASGMQCSPPFTPGSSPRSPFATAAPMHHPRALQRLPSLPESSSLWDDSSSDVSLQPR